MTTVQWLLVGAAGLALMYVLTPQQDSPLQAYFRATEVCWEIAAHDRFVQCDTRDKRVQQ